MGKRLISQNRAKGTPTYRSKNIGYCTAKYTPQLYGAVHRKITDLKNDPSRTSLISVWTTDEGKKLYTIAHMGAHVGYELDSTSTSEGSIKQLKDIACFTPLFNLPLRPFDTGKLA